MTTETGYGFQIEVLDLSFSLQSLGPVYSFVVSFSPFYIDEEYCSPVTRSQGRERVSRFGGRDGRSKPFLSSTLLVCPDIYSFDVTRHELDRLGNPSSVSAAVVVSPGPRELSRVTRPSLPSPFCVLLTLPVCLFYPSFRGVPFSVCPYRSNSMYFLFFVFLLQDDPTMFVWYCHDLSPLSPLFFFLLRSSFPLRTVS